MCVQLRTVWPSWGATALAIFCSLIFFVAASLVSIHRHWQYETQYYDFGIFDTALRQAARFQLPHIDHLWFEAEPRPIFADHFHPAVFLLTPLYWFTTASEWLLVVQAAAVALSGYVLFALARHLLHRDVLALAVLLAYFLFVGLQNAVITDFHEVTVMTLPLMVVYWAVVTGRPRVLVLSFVVTLAFKELLFVLGLGLAWFVYWYRPAWRRLALVMGLYALLWGVLTIGVIIPAFNQGAYHYFPTSAAGNIFDQVQHWASQLLGPPQKVIVLVQVLLSFAFLPLLSWMTLPIWLSHFGMRFLAESSNKWSLGFHYNAEVVPTLAVATVLALWQLRRRFGDNVAAAAALILVLTSLVCYRLLFRGPLALAYNPAFYAHTQNFAYLDQFLARVPRQGEVVMTQNNLATRFTARRVVLLRENYHELYPDWIIVDLRPGQNPNNLMGVADPPALVAQLRRDPQYHLFYQEAERYIFRRR